MNLNLASKRGSRSPVSGAKASLELDGSSGQINQDDHTEDHHLKSSMITTKDIFRLKERELTSFIDFGTGEKKVRRITKERIPKKKIIEMLGYKHADPCKLILHSLRLNENKSKNASIDSYDNNSSIVSLRDQLKPSKSDANGHRSFNVSLVRKSRTKDSSTLLTIPPEKKEAKEPRLPSNNFDSQDCAEGTRNHSPLSGKSPLPVVMLHTPKTGYLSLFGSSNTRPKPTHIDFNAFAPRPAGDQPSLLLDAHRADLRLDKLPQVRSLSRKLVKSPVDQMTDDCFQVTPFNNLIPS